jgi:hypothetical protein
MARRQSRGGGFHDLPADRLLTPGAGDPINVLVFLPAAREELAGILAEGLALLL